MALLLGFSLVPAGMLGATPSASAGKATRPRTHAGAAMPAPARALLQEAQPALMSPTATVAIPRPFDSQGVVELYHLRFERVDEEGLSWQVNQRVFDIRSAGGASVFGVDDLWYDGSRSHFLLWKAQVIRNGQVVAEGHDGGDSIPGATGNRSRRLDLPQLKAGDRVNIIYVLAPAHEQQWKNLGRRYLGDLFAFRSSYPVVQVKYVLHSTERLAVSQAKLAPPQVSDTDGQWSWTWSGGPYAAFYSDQDGPSITDRSPFVQVSSFESWPELVKWYEGELRRRARMSPALKRKLLRLAPPQATPMETVQTVWAYLSQHLSYHGVEEGVHAYVPSPVGKVFDDGSGDCKDGALLLSTWLRAEGVPAYVALVRTRPMGRVAQGAATMAAFDHAIVRVPSLNLWIDTTAPDFRVPEVPSSDQNGLALVVRPGVTGLKRIPLAPADENVTRRMVRLHAVGNGWYEAVGDIDVRGADAPTLRREYWAKKGTARRKVFDRWLSGIYPGAQVERIAVSGVHSSQPWIRIHFEARLRPGKMRPVAWTPRHYARILAFEAHRPDTLRLPLRWTTEETWELDGAHTACPARLTPVRQSGPFGSVEVDASCQPGHLVVHSLAVQSAERVAPADYGKFQEFWRNADALLNGSVGHLPTGTLEAGARPPATPEAPAQTATAVTPATGSQQNAAQ